MRRLAALLVLAALVPGCSHRERANPFDPRNPATRGSPSGFIALAGNGRVDLSWDFVASDGLYGYRLYRRTAEDTTFRPVSIVMPPTATSYHDVRLRNGLDYTYRLKFVFGEGERGQPAEETATPGAARPWVVDPGPGLLLRLTPDGRHVAFSQAGLGDPTAVGVDSIRGLVWVSDSSGGRVVVLEPATGVTVSIPGLVSPGAIAVEPRGGSAWVCDERGRKLYEFDSGGTPIGSTIEPVETPIGVAIDVSDRSVWVAERGASRVRRLRADHSLMWSLAVDRPSRVAVDSLTGRGWVTSFESGNVFRIAPSGSIELAVPGFRGPIGVAVDSRRGRIWIADAYGNRLVALDRAGNQQLQVTGLSEVRDVAVEPESGEVWAVAPGQGEVVRVSTDGLVLRRLGGFRRPLGVAVDPGPR